MNDRHRLLEEGDVFELKKGMAVYTDVSERFVYSNRSGVNDVVTAEVLVGTIYKDGGVVWDSSDLCGEYLVTNTALTGGGTGMGLSDVYPDGHCVYAERVDGQPLGGGVRVSFYQTGCFTAMNPSVPVIRRMKKTVRWSAE